MLSVRLFRRGIFLALPLALVLLFLLSTPSEAHAILLKSNPAKDAVLAIPPSEVQMDFSEDLNTATSAAYVVNAAGQHVDVNGGLVLPTNLREMTVSLKPNLPSDVYVVIWRTQSAADGHVLSGSFLFSVAAPDGSVPQLKGAVPGLNAPGNSTSGANGQLDIPTLFNLLMIFLVDLGSIFWAGAQLWRTFVPHDEDNEEQRTLERRSEERFDLYFSQSLLRILFLANIGVLLAEALTLTGGQWGQIFSLSLLSGLLTGRFGTFWVMREVVIVLAMIVGAYTILARQKPAFIKSLLPWANLILALALLIALTFSGHSAAVSGQLGAYAIIVDWLHLLAASLWIGGMLYISLAYLPILKDNTPMEQARILLGMLPRFSPLAIAGVIIMTLSGPFNATVHMTSWEQLYQTAYGRTLLIKVFLVASLLITSAIHVGLFRPRLAKDYRRFQDLREEQENNQAEQSDETQPEQKASETLIESKQLAQSIGQQTQRLNKVLKWEPALGIGVLLCTALLGVFAGTLTPQTVTPPAGQGNQQQVKPFTSTAKTDDGKFTITLTVSPNRFGPNTFTARVVDSNGTVDTNVGVSLYTQMLDMDMGTDTINLQPDGKGNFSANGDLSMAGHWKIRIQVRTPDNKLHNTSLQLTTAQ